MTGPAFTLAALALAGLMQLSTVAMARDAAEASAARAPIASFTGASTGVRETGWVRVTSQEALTALWGEHAQVEWQHVPALAVDFERCIVLAYFQPNTTNASGVTIESIESVDAGLRVRYDVVQYQTMSIGEEPDRGVASAPFGFFVVDRYEGPLVFEENVQGIIGQPPVWKHRWSLGATTADSERAHPMPSGSR